MALNHNHAYNLNSTCSAGKDLGTNLGSLGHYSASTGSSRILHETNSAMIGSVWVQMADHLPTDAHPTYRDSKGSKILRYLCSFQG